MQAASTAKLTLVRRAALVFASAALSVASVAQQPAKTVPNLMTFSGTVSAAPSSSGVAGVTFALYKDQDGGAPLWIETQSVQLDATGHYTVQLGATKPNGVPIDLFASGEARWLGVRPEGSPEQPRVLLVSVPYALKAADADTIGGRPASAFVLAPSVDTASNTSADSAVPPPAGITGAGTTNFLPLWTSASNLGSSVLFQSGSGATAKLGIGTTTPTSVLDVKGSTAIRGVLNLPATGVANATTGKNSQPETFTTSSFNSGSSTAINQTFRWQAEPAGNNTAAASGTLNLLFAQGSGTPAETGLKIASNGRITFASGQTFPGSGSGTVTSVAFTAPASDFNVTGSPVTGAGTLGFNWKLPPTSANTAGAIVKRDATGSFSANSITMTGSVSSTTANSIGVFAHTTPTTGQTIALYGVTDSASDNATGVLGLAPASSNGFTLGVVGVSNSFAGVGVLGYGSPGTLTGVGQLMQAQTSYGIWGDSNEGFGVLGTSDFGSAVVAVSNSEGTILPTASFRNLSSGYVLETQGPDGNCSIDTSGNLGCSGVVNAASTRFIIDHPLDPANKYLLHSSMQSPESKTVYDGVAQLDAAGEAWVKLPDYVEALNRDFRYQLTCLGAFAPVYVAQEISNHQFRIGGGKPGMKVSWQVTGVRQDAWTNAHLQAAEEEKPADERGYYLHPDAFGQPREKGIAALKATKRLAGLRKRTTATASPRMAGGN